MSTCRRLVGQQGRSWVSTRLQTKQRTAACLHDETGVLNLNRGRHRRTVSGRAGSERTIITVEDVRIQLNILGRILDKGLSVRQVEEIVRNLSSEKKNPKEKQAASLPGNFEKGKDILGSRLESHVEIQINRKGKGFIKIPFGSGEDFDRIISRLES